MVTIENYEEYLMMAADGELSFAEQAMLDAFMARHPELRGEAAAWQSLHLEPDEAIRFDGKEALLRKARPAIFIGWRPYTMAAAAALAVLLMLSRQIPAPSFRIAAPAGDMLAVARTGVRPFTRPVAATAAHPAGIAARVPAAPTAQKVVAYHNTMAVETQHTMPSLPELSMAATGELSTSAYEVPAAGSAEIPLVQDELQPSGSGSGQFHFQLQNQQAIAFVAQGIESRIRQVKKAARAIHETALVVRLGGNNVHLNF